MLLLYALIPDTIHVLSSILQYIERDNVIKTCDGLFLLRFPHMGIIVKSCEHLTMVVCARVYCNSLNIKL